jgi:hypothetical protein
VNAVITSETRRTSCSYPQQHPPDGPEGLSRIRDDPSGEPEPAWALRRTQGTGQSAAPDGCPLRPGNTFRTDELQ